METPYRTKIQEIQLCLSHLDEAEISEEAQRLISVAWANLSLACSEKFKLGKEKNYHIVMVETRESNGSVEIELSKSPMDEGEQSKFNSFVEACKNGICCQPLSEAKCIDKFKEIKALIP